MTRGLLKNRTFLTLTALFCAVESVWSWLSVERVQLPENPATIVGLLSISFYVLLICGIGSFAYRSRFWEDRIVLGLVAGVVVLIAIKATVPLASPSMVGVNVVKSSMLTVAALVTLSVLVRDCGDSPRNKPVTSSDERGQPPGQDTSETQEDV